MVRGEAALTRKSFSRKERRSNKSNNNTDTKAKLLLTVLLSIITIDLKNYR